MKSLTSYNIIFTLRTSVLDPAFAGYPTFRWVVNTGTLGEIISNLGVMISE